MHLLYLFVFHQDGDKQIEEFEVRHVSAARHLVFEHQIQHLVRRQRCQLCKHAGILKDQLCVNAVDVISDLRVSSLKPYALRYSTVLSCQSDREIDPAVFGLQILLILFHL